MFDLAYIRTSYNLDALRKKWSREKGEATGWPAGYYSKSIVIPNTPVVYMSFLDHTDEELRSPANAQHNWYTGMCLVSANCTDEHRRELVDADTADTNDTRLDSLEAQAVAKALENAGGHRGKASTQLGISRRTLTRKLRQYGLSSARSSGPTLLGSLSYEQQQYFRAEMKVPVLLVTTEDQELTCTSANLSAGGMGLEGLMTAPSYQCGLRVRFRFPDSKATVEVLARLAWAGMQGRAGITFTDVNPAARQEIRRWLRQKMAEEGWMVMPEPTESLAE